jgi:hypothetical protein
LHEHTSFGIVRSSNFLGDDATRRKRIDSTKRTTVFEGFERIVVGYKKKD